MKFTKALALILTVCCMTLSGCKAAPKNSISTDSLSENERQLVSLVDSNAAVFDFKVDGAYSITVDTYELKDGGWVKTGSVLSLSDEVSPENEISKGRVALSYDMNNMFGVSRAAVQINNGSLATYNSNINGDKQENWSAMSTTGDLEITLNKPLPLMVFYSYTSDVDSKAARTPSSAWADTSNLNCAAAQMVTVTFYDSYIF